MKYWEFLKGRKTYIVGIATLVFATIGIGFGYLEPDRAIELVLLALGYLGLRHGLSTEVEGILKKVVKK